MASLLILTLPFRQLYHSLPLVLGSACKKATGALYIHFDPLSTQRPTEKGVNIFSIKEASQAIQNVYSRTLSLAPNLNVRVLMGGFKGNFNIPLVTKYPIEHVMVDLCPDEHLNIFSERYSSYLENSAPHVILKSKVNIKDEDLADIPLAESDKVYNNIVAGGTFDRIHIGHKILVSEGLLRCSKKFTIGMADGPLLAKKTLMELIEPVEERISSLNEFLTDVDSSVKYRLEPIYEPCGPSGEDPEMEMIIVSQETLRGGNYVNRIRAERNLCNLDVSVIELIDDPSRNSVEERKVSSSSMRMRSLGTLMKPRKTDVKDGSPLIIGLTGGSCNGKTTLAKKISNLGGSVIDCDKLGHAAYKKNSTCYFKLVDMFGSEILNSEKEVDRKSLGAIVFKDKSMLAKLNQLVWPEIYALVEEQITELKNRGQKLIFLDAAVLLEAKWDQFCNEVWVCIVPPEEAVKRICSRDSCSEQSANDRLSSQLTNKERVAAANVVLCSLWDHSYTEQQLERAWSRLVEEGFAPTQIGKL